MFTFSVLLGAVLISFAFWRICPFHISFLLLELLWETYPSIPTYSLLSVRPPVTVPISNFSFFFFNISIVLSGIYQLLLTFQRIGFGFVNFLYCLLSILLISALNNFFLLHVSIKLIHHFSFLRYKFWSMTLSFSFFFYL